MQHSRALRHAPGLLVATVIAVAALGGPAADTASGARAARATTPAPAVKILRPRAGERISGSLRPRIRIGRRGRVRRLELRVDGRLQLAWSPRRRVSPRLSTRRLRNGAHVLEVRAIGRPGVSRSVRRRVRVVNGPRTRSRPARRATPGAGRDRAARPSTPGRERTATPSPDAAPAPSPPTPSPAPPPFSGSGLDIPGTILRTGDFNGGTLAGWSGHQAARAYSLTVTGSPVREGGYAARFEVRAGDDPLCINGWGCYGDRAEVQMSTGEAEGQERWYSWSTMIGAGFPRSSAWQVVSQWHADAAGSPPIGFYAENDDLVLRFHRHSGPGSLINIVDAWRGPLRRGTWQDIRLHVKWSASDVTGFVELWIDGVPQTFDTGGTRRSIRNLYPGGIGNYFKQGLYRQAGMGQTGVVHHDGFRMSRP